MKYYGIIVGIVVVSSAVCITACHSSNAAGERRALHMAELTYGDGSLLYADKVDNRSVIQSVENDSNTVFCCYRVGISDSIIYDKKQEEAWGKYFNYDMQYDWIALCNGDSLHTVFFQPAMSSHKQTREGILVFEAPKGVYPDSLIYKRSYGVNKVNQLVVLKSHK